MKPGVVIDGTWFANVGEIGWETDADGGTAVITWSMNLPERFTHHALVRGKLVQVKAGSANLAAGVLSQPDVNTAADGSATWTFTANGLAAAGRGFLALNSSGGTTTTPDTAIDAAIARGLPWHRPTSLSSSSFTGTEDTDSLNKVGDLLDVWAQSTSKRWGVDADGNVYATADPITPMWHMTPGSGRFGLADDNYASAVFVRYWNGSGFATASATDSTAAAMYGTEEYVVDALAAGVLTSTKASGLAQGALDAGKARLGWTNSLTPNRWQLTTPGGTPAPLWMVRAGQMVRLHGVLDEQGQPLPYVDFVIGHTAYNSATDELTISPVQLASRDLTSVIASAAGGQAA